MSSSPSTPAKTIILAFDGTLGKFTKHPSNVLRLFGLLDRGNMDEQAVYFQPGVGTNSAEGDAWSPTVKALNEKLDSMLTRYLDIRILDGYRFLMKRYRPGDHVCMFGFSRGAYTARCLAGMLNKVGLLSPDADQMVASAYERYLDTSPAGRDLARDFKYHLGRPCPVEFLGLWDTVSSVGLAGSYHLPLSTSNSAVKIVRHALALDERRMTFGHLPWYGIAPEDSSSVHQSFPSRVFSAIRPSSSTLSSVPPLHPGPEDIQAVDNQLRYSLADVKEVWFAGCHLDVGGGHGDPDSSNTLSDPSLCWMINQVLASGTPVRFSIEALNDLQGIQSVLANPVPTSLKDKHPNESARRSDLKLQKVEQLDLGRNAKSRIHDELQSGWFGWVPEFWPTRKPIFDRHGNPWTELGLPNFGRGRKIWEADVLIHESVKLRLEGGSYQPMAEFGHKNPHVQYVDDWGKNMGEGRVVRGRLELGEASL